MPDDDRDAIDDRLAALARSRFRARFRLRPAERRVLAEKGLPTVLAHARALLTARLAPATPANDGKQTPYRGHPVFIAQHATATCCRGCLQKWHGVPRGRAMTADELDRAVRVIGRWIEGQRVPETEPAPLPPPMLWEE